MVQTVRELVDLFAQGHFKQALAESQALSDSLGNNQSQRAKSARLYCTVVSSLCLIETTRASSQIANALIEVSHEAYIAGNKRLSLLSLWYAVCCRFMYLYSPKARKRPGNEQDIRNLDGELQRLSALADQLGDRTLAAVATTMRVEYALRTNVPSATTRALIIQAEERMKGASRDTSRLIFREAFLIGIQEADGKLPRQRVPHASLLYLPGELEGTFD